MISPVLLKIGPMELRWYGVMAATGILCAYGLMQARRQKAGISTNDLDGVMTIAVVGGILGARLLYVMRFWEAEFAHRSLSAVFKIWEGGLVFQGGFLLAALGIVIYCLCKHISVGSLGDLLAPALPFGHAFGRIGCLINGCCFGLTPYEGPFAIHYTSGVQVGHFPVQAVAALANLCLCGLLLWLEKRKKATGRLFLVYLMGYTILRFATEYLRGDYPQEQYWHGLTPGQFNALWQLPLLVVIYILLYVFAERKKNTQTTAATASKARHHG